jgi:H+/Cl- antiporter ClcA
MRESCQPAVRLRAIAWRVWWHTTVTTPPADVSDTRRPLPAMLLAAAFSLVLGYFVLQVVNSGIRTIWETIPETWEQTPAWYVLGVLVTSAVLVYVVRRFVGDTGHPPIAGITVSPLSPKGYFASILAILASLWGGMVLGPEVALVATGSVIGGLVITWLRVTGASAQKKVVGFGALGGLLALFVGPLLGGTLKLGGPSQSFEVDELGWAVLVAVIVALVVTGARVVAALVARIAGPGPNLKVLIGSAVVVGVAAVIHQSMTGEAVIYVVTSGEELISALPQLTSVSTVISIIVLKSIAYAVSLGSGFRGGPFFPAMFVGAAVGLLASLMMDDGPSVAAGIVVGVVAAVIATAPMKWPLVIVLGIVLGYAVGSWALVPAALVGAIVARAIPRFGDRVKTAELVHSA